MAKTIEALRKRFPDLGETVAMDSTDVPTYANKFRKPCSDPDAKWGVKRNSGGEEEKWLGYKMHLVGDAKYEIPLMPIVTPANANDSPLLIPLLEKNKEWTKRSSKVIADKGYDAVENYRYVVEDITGIPVIDLNLRGSKGKPDRFEDIANEYGQPYCAWNIPYISLYFLGLR